MNYAKLLNENLTNTDIILCTSRKAYSKVFEYFTDYPEEFTSGAITTELRNNNSSKMIYIVGIDCDFETLSLLQIKALLVHELSHVATMHMLDYNFTCDEYRSGFIQFMHQEFIPFIDDIYEKIKISS